MSENNPRWKHAVIDAYQPLESVKGWKKCPACKEFPRVWVFDNGATADCCCGEKYQNTAVRSESILSVAKRCGGSITEYSRDNLRIRWNQHVATGEPLNTLPEGQW